MYEKFKTWIKEFFHNPISVILLVLFVALFAWTVLGSNLSGNGNTVDTVREQLDRIETTKSDIEEANLLFSHATAPQKTFFFIPNKGS